MILSRLPHLTRGSENVEGEPLLCIFPLDSVEMFSNAAADVVAACFPFEISGKTVGVFF